MNKKGQALGIGIIVAVTIFIIGLSTLNLVMPEVDRARNSDNLDCTNSTGISDGTKLTCLTVDWAIPGLFLAILSVSGGAIASKFVGGKR